MKKEAKILVLLSVLVAAGAGVALYLYDSGRAPPSSAPTNPGMTLREEFVREDSPSLGPKDARVTLVEFLDPECESCRAMFPIVKSILNEYQGRIHFVVRYMPFHVSSLMAIAATESAGLQGRYWEMQELLFNMADEWGHQPSPRKDLFINYASTLGLDVDKFTKDLDDPKWIQKAQRDKADGDALGVRGTPTFYVNGETVERLGYQGLKDSLAPYLTEGKPKDAAHEK